ncbi:helix-turn-helix domain-containing protein [Vibrio harveyi]|uniref:helix-turn-helix domain-containing protein n=2 Tax=Vibrio harveyi group TaxID=717610 RepID=UPI003BB495C0
MSHTKNKYLQLQDTGQKNTPYNYKKVNILGFYMIGEQIKSLRESRNLKQEDVANAINIAKSTYIKYEKGTQSPQLETVEKIAKLYGVAVCELIGGQKPSLDEQLISKMELISQLDEDEKKSIMLMIDGLVYRRQNIELMKTL